jgi:branched-chain amino acid transport system substrate-binding protein
MNVVFQEQYPWGTTDFYALWNKMLPTKPDAINVAGMMAGSAGPFVKQGRELGFNGPIFNGMAVGYPKVFLDLAGKDTTDFFSLDLLVDSPDAPSMVKQIVQMVSDEYHTATASDHVYGFEATWDMAQAIEKAQSIDSTDVKNSFEKMTSIETPMGAGYMGGESTWGVKHVIVHPEPIFAVTNGTMKQVKWMTPNVP